MFKACPSRMSIFIASLSFGLVLLSGCRPQNALETPPAGRASLTLASETQPAADLPNAANAGIVDIQNPELQQYRRVIAVSDVHGQYIEIWHLLLASGVIQVTPTPGTQESKPGGALSWSADWKGSGTLLVVTGDSIDKGPQSLEVLKLWYDLQRKQKNNNRIVVLLGNHEAEYLATPSHSKAKMVHEELIGQGYKPEDLADSKFVTHDGYPLGKFMRDLPLAARVGQWFFCHAGWIPDPALLDSNQTTPEGRWTAFVKAGSAAVRGGHYASLVSEGDEETDSNAANTGPLVPMLEKKTDTKGRKWWKKEIPDLEARLTDYGLYGVVFGHRPKAFGIEDAIGISSPTDSHLVKIDSGMAVPSAPKEDGSDTPSDWPQPYMGHLLQFPNPAELAQGQHPPVMQSLGFSKALVTAPLSAP